MHGDRLDPSVFTPSTERVISSQLACYQQNGLTIQSLLQRHSATAVLVLVGMLSWLFAGCGPKTSVAADQRIPVRVQTPDRVERPDSAAASGAVEADVTAEAAFQTGGRVAKVLVDEGQSVATGQLLAELDAADYRNAYDAATAQDDAAQAAQTKALAGLRPEELEQARIDYEQWLDRYTRMKYLYDHRSLPANDFKTVEAGYQAATQRYEMARQGTRGEEKQAAGAQMRAAAAQVREARKRLSDCQLRAPIAGVVGMRRIDVGDTVAAGVPVIAVLDLNPVNARVGIPETEIGKVRLGERATIAIPALGGRAFDGKVDTVGVAADPVSRTYTVKIAVPNPQQSLKAGMIAEARIFSPEMVKVMTVPGNAIVRDPRGVTEVFVYEPTRQRVYARRVEVGAPFDTQVEVRGGLTGNELVVVAGQQNVREASLVKVVGGGQ